MLQMSSPVPGLDYGLRTGLTRLTGMTSETDPLDDLYTAVGDYTGLGATSPFTGEIIGAIVAAVTTARLIERPQFNGGAVPHPREETSGRYVQAVPRTLRSPAWSRQARPEDRNGHHDFARLSLARTPVDPAAGQMCSVFAVDIVGFTRPDRDDDIRLYLHQRLYEYLQKVFDDSGIPWAESFREDRGDGALIVIPPEIPAKGLIDPLPERLRSLVRRHNHVSCAAANMQLRAAVHIGPVEHDNHGFVGTDVNFAFRMLEARPLKRLLAESGAELGLVVSSFVYDSIVLRHPCLVHPDAFRPLRFQTKNTRARAWTYLPGASS
jgi:class 3 adenylate cyclase